MAKPKFSWQILLVTIIILAGIGAAGYLWHKEKPTTTNIKTAVLANGYKEHTFESEYRDLGFTHGAWREILQSEDTLAKTANPLPAPEWKFVGSESGNEIWKVGNDTYEFKGSMLNFPFLEQFGVYKNGVLVFRTQMNYGTDGPFIQKDLLNDKLAVTFLKSCGGEQVMVCEHEIYYDGKYISEEFKIKNPRHLFFYEGKLGFIIQTESGDVIFFNGRIISNTYDKIHFMNCCSIQEILPMVYDNGVLLFYAVQNENQDYLIEIDLRNHLQL